MFVIIYFWVQDRFGHSQQVGPYYTECALRVNSTTKGYVDVELTQIIGLGYYRLLLSTFDVYKKYFCVQGRFWHSQQMGPGAYYTKKKIPYL